MTLFRRLLATDAPAAVLLIRLILGATPGAELLSACRTEAG